MLYQHSWVKPQQFNLSYVEAILGNDIHKKSNNRLWKCKKTSIVFFSFAYTSENFEEESQLLLQHYSWTRVPVTTQEMFMSWVSVSEAGVTGSKVCFFNETELTAGCSCAALQKISWRASEPANTSDDVRFSAVHCTVCRCCLFW